MKKFCLTTSIVFILILPLISQVTIGLHTAYSGYIGLHHEFSLEVPVIKNFSLNSRVSYAVNRGFMFRTGIRYEYPVFTKTKIRFGLDLGSFLETDRSRDGYQQSYFMKGMNVGIQQDIGKRWGILAEFGWMSLHRKNVKWDSAFPQLGVTYKIFK